MGLNRRVVDQLINNLLCTHLLLLFSLNLVTLALPALNLTLAALC